MLAVLSEKRSSDPDWIFERNWTASVASPSAVAPGCGCCHAWSKV